MGTEEMLAGAIEGALMGFLVSYVVPPMAGQDDEGEKKSRPFYVGGGAFLGALRKVLKDRQDVSSRRLSDSSAHVGFIAPPLGPSTPPGPDNRNSPCPQDYVLDETGHCVYAPELPWPMMSSSVARHRAGLGGGLEAGLGGGLESSFAGLPGAWQMGYDFKEGSR
jgi:hypothetical protein